MQETISKQKSYKVALKSGVVFEFSAAGFVADKSRIVFYEAFWREGGLAWRGASAIYDVRKSELALLHRGESDKGDRMEFGADELFED